MRKSRLWGISVMVLFMLASSALAISSDLKPVYAPGETMIIEIKGNILEPLQAEQVSFLRGHVKVPFDYELKKLEERYFLWAHMPLNTTQNYALLISNIVTTVNGQRSNLDYRQNFSVSGNRTAYTVKPGLIFATKDFELAIESYEDEDFDIELDFPVKEKKVLKPGINKLKFSITSIEGTQFIVIHIGNYEIPAYIVGNLSKQSSKPDFIHLRPERILRTHGISEREIIYQVILSNSRDKKIEGIEIIYNQELLSVKPEITYVQAEGEIAFNISVNREIFKQEQINEIIYIISKTENFSLSLPIEINFYENTSAGNLSGNNASVLGLYYCSELGGRICTAQEYCSGNEEISLDGNCCVGQCSFEEDNDSRKWIGWTITAFVLLILGYIYFKYRKVKDDKNPIDSKIKEAEKNIRLP